MTQEALKLALPLLEDCVNSYRLKYERPAFDKAIAAIKEALAQPEQECPNLKNCNGACFQCEYFNVETGEMEYPVAQPEQDPVAWRTFDGEGGYDYRLYEDNESYADDWNKRNPNHAGWVDKLYTHSQPEQQPTNIERHEANVQKFLGAPQPKQEPVATFDEVWDLIDWDKWRMEPIRELVKMIHSKTTLPQRTWVGLAIEDCEEVERWVEFKEEGSGRIPIGKLARYIEAKLKEKNT